MSLYRTGSLTTVAREISEYKRKLDLLGVQEVRWDRGGTEPADDYTVPIEMGMRTWLRTGFLLRQQIVSSVKRAESVGDRMSRMILRRGR
jgi:hypothetical protein